jgi:outer membrane protein assembly factor BamB
MKFWMGLVFAMFLWVQPLAASQPAVDTLPPELVRLRDEGRLTVRALWAWNLVPQTTAGMALELKALGLDLLEADQARLTQWAGQADAGELQLTPGQREMLDVLLGWMNSGAGEPSQAEAVVAPSPADQIAQADGAVVEPDTVGAVPQLPEVPDPPAADSTVPGEANATVAAEDVQELLPTATEAVEPVQPGQVGQADQLGSVDAGIREGATGPGDVVTMYRGGAERTGVVDSPGPAGPPAELWKLKVGEGTCTAPVVLGGVACFGSGDGHLYAVDVAAGVLKWKFFAEDWIDQPPAMALGMVFFGNVVGDKSGDRHLFALDAATGSEKWRLRSLYYSVDSSPAFVDETVFCGVGKHLYSVDPQTGVEKWSFEATDSVGTPAIAGGVAFFAHANRLTAVELGADAEKWTFRSQANISTCPVVSDGVVYFGASDEFQIYAVDVLTGQEKWKFSTGLIHHPPAVHDGVVYAVSFDNLQALDAQTGTLQWTVNTARESLKAPVISGDTIFVGAGKFLLALDRATGQEKWRFEVGEEITGPAVSDGTIYFWSADGYFHAVR